MIKDPELTHRTGQELWLWLANPDDYFPEAAIESFSSVLSSDEWARWRSLCFAQNRSEYLATHATLRIALSHHLARPASAWSFRYDQYGKPALTPEMGIRFNLSNTLGLAVCLIARDADVGVDVEPYQHAAKIIEVASEVFSTDEIAQLSALAEVDRLNRALSLWTLKEAYIKARGQGMSLPLRKISFLFDDSRGIRFELDPSFADRASRWRFCLLDCANHRVALATDCSEHPDLHIFQVDPLRQEPIQLELIEKLWFPLA
jgi:4'-phosphopantetheinyl transferase